MVEVKLATRPPKFIRPTKQTGNRKVGLRYEAKAQGYILRCLEESVGSEVKAIIAPWFVFRSEGDRADHVRYCQPDAILFDAWERKLTIIEIKLQHCIETYNQVRKLYEPVVSAMYPEYSIAAVELVQWYDPHIVFPETYYFEPDILQAQAHKLAVHIWNPRYDKARASASSARQLTDSPPS